MVASASWFVKTTESKVPSGTRFNCDCADINRVRTRVVRIERIRVKSDGIAVAVEVPGCEAQDCRGCPENRVSRMSPRISISVKTGTRRPPVKHKKRGFRSLSVQATDWLNTGLLRHATLFCGPLLRRHWGNPFPTPLWRPRSTGYRIEQADSETRQRALVDSIPCPQPFFKLSSPTPRHPHQRRQDESLCPIAPAGRCAHHTGNHLPQPVQVEQQLPDVALFVQGLRAVQEKTRNLADLAIVHTD